LINLAVYLSLFQDAFQGSGRNVIALFTGNGYQSGLCWVFELSMATACSGKSPPICFD
jgi:hypothetical protein